MASFKKGGWVTEKEQGTSDRFEPKSYTLNFTLSRLGLRFMEMHRLTPRLAIPPISGLGVYCKIHWILPPLGK